MQEGHELRRLRWKCRRGMLELDRLLMNFLNLGYNSLTLKDKALFEDLLGHSDQNLLTWLLASNTAPQEYNYVIKKIRADAQA